MQKTITLPFSVFDIEQESIIEQNIRQALALKTNDVLYYQKIKCSLDARKRPVHFNLSLQVFVNEPAINPYPEIAPYLDVHQAEQVLHIIGAGPAGLFCALRCLQLGIKPILFERGKDVKSRRRDLAQLNKKGILNEESNYCFGEGGAGTYSDGKLYTRSNKRGNVYEILQTFVHHGAPNDILFWAHPHIGTNKLPQIMEHIREQILQCGGEIFFNAKLSDFSIKENKIQSIEINHSDMIPVQNVVLATGHSADDVYTLLHKKNILLEAKDFALGVRIEHSQEQMNEMQYGKIHAQQMKENAACALQPASYSLVEQVDGRGVFSFCMCPGGIIAPASTTQNALVVNGWSPSKRNNPFANSGLVVGIKQEDVSAFEHHGVLAALHFRKNIEQKCFDAGGGKFVAPAQSLQDFLHNKLSKHELKTSYLPGVKACNLNEILPPFISHALKQGVKQYAKKVKNYIGSDVNIVATESRTSAPIRIPRYKDLLQHVQISNLYPCAEGAGYAGGIVSAAMDGQKIAERLKEKKG